MKKATSKPRVHLATHLACIVGKSFDTMETVGLTSGLVGYMESAVEQFRLAEKALDQAGLDDYEKENDQGKSYAQARVVLDPMRRALEKLTKAYMADPGEALVPDPDYTMCEVRQEFARRCLESGMREGRIACQWPDAQVDMTRLQFSDALAHFVLARALLSGDRQQIEEAAQMDTACREELDLQVWNFVRDDLSDIVSLRPNRPRKRAILGG